MQLGQKQAEIAVLEAEVFSPESPLNVENDRLKEQVDKLQGQLRGLICDVHNSKTLDFAEWGDMVCPQAGILAKRDDMPGVSSAQGAPGPRSANAAAARGPEGTAASPSAVNLRDFQGGT